ncbi:HAD-like domain-containing protein [Hyaloraphidium curvatum]|nr:HAD-like domain-containing protein [Hyaloraphidium curvatum]
MSQAPKGTKRKPSTSSAVAPSASSDAGPPDPTYSALVLDIEGTLCPLSFVHENLFPYVERNLRPYIDAHWGDEAFGHHKTALRDLARADAASSDERLKQAPQIPDGDGDDARDGLEANVRWQMSWDRKGGALKTLQGEMWKEGYEAGDIQGFIYDDVVRLFKALKGFVPIYIYSSGSILGQKLIFGFSNHGDLLPYIKGHYDTSIGPKLEKASYEKIRADLGIDGKILFVSDNVKELEAAHAAAFDVALAVRPGNHPVPLPLLISGTEIPSVSSCDELLRPPFADPAPAEKRIRVETVSVTGDEDEDGASDAVSLALVSARATIGDDEAASTARSLEDEESTKDGS